MRAITHDALASCPPGVSTQALRRELGASYNSAILFNRGLREAVQAAVRDGQVSMSEIAMRCHTSWVNRRTGQQPERGKDRPSSWVHSDVLALIAREGLGISPNEVEL